MELPANPAMLSLTGYDEYGRPISATEVEARARSGYDWQLSDDDGKDELEYDQTTAFGIEGGFY